MRIGATPSMASCFKTHEGAIYPEYVSAPPAAASRPALAPNRRRLIRSLRAAQLVGRALGDALELGQALRLAAAQVRPAAVERHAQGSVSSCRPQLGQRGSLASIELSAEAADEPRCAPGERAPRESSGGR